MLSPENYIKQKARTLPVHECWINSSWNRDKLANIIVARKHTNGNFTVGSYLVDINCLGLKDTQYFFNISPLEYSDIIDYHCNNFETKSIEYILAHNIVYAGVEFADEYGFKPHKDFAITKYILEDDTDDIELIDIECGKNGMPVYIRGPFENEARAKQIIAQLEKNAGKDSYHYFDEISADDEDLYEKVFFGKEESDESLNRFDAMESKEKLRMFSQLLAKINKLSHDEKADLGDLTESIICEHLDFDKVDDLFYDFLDESNKYVINDEITDEFLFGCYLPEFDPSEIRREFLILYNQIFDDSKEAETKIRKLQKKYPKIPSLCFLEIVMLSANNSKKYEKTLSDYAEIFPEYPLINIHKLISMINSNGSPLESLIFGKAIGHFFGGRQSINNIEIFNLLMLLIFSATASGSLEELDAIDFLTEEFDFCEEDADVLDELITITKLNFISSLIKKT